MGERRTILIKFILYQLCLSRQNEPPFSDTTKETVPRQGSSSELENDNPDLSDKSSLGILIPTKQSNACSDKSSLEILFAEAQSSENEDKYISDISMKTDETDFDAKTSLQFLFDESLRNESTNAGSNFAWLFTIQPLPDIPIVLAPNTGQSRHLYNRSYSADYYRGDPEVVIEPKVLRRRHMTRISKRSGDSTALVGNVVMQKRMKQPGPDGTSGVERGEERRQEDEQDEQTVWCVDRMIILTVTEGSGPPTNSVEREVEETVKKIL